MKNLLYVLHSGITGGTFLTNRDLMKNMQNDYNIYLLGAENSALKLFQFRDDNLTLIKEYERNIKWSAKNFKDSWLTYVYFDILIDRKIDLVHIRHLINHSFDLPNVAKRLDIPVVLSMHDFYFLCPFYTLIDENEKYCKGICSDNNISCYNPLKTLDDINSKEFITQWRDNVVEMFSNVDYFVTTSDYVKDLFLSIYEKNIHDDIFKVIEHGRDFTSTDEYYEVPSENNPIKILFPANHLNLMKGSKLIKDIKALDVDNKLEFHFLGNCHDDIEESGIAHGTYERDDFYLFVDEIKPSFIGVFSIWPETFCHTITESWSCGIPVIGTNIGVIEDRILKHEGGWVIDRNNPEEAYKQILEIAANTNEYLQVQNNIKNMHLKTTSQMADEYKQIYEELL